MAQALLQARTLLLQRGRGRAISLKLGPLTSSSLLLPRTPLKPCSPLHVNVQTRCLSRDDSSSAGDIGSGAGTDSGAQYFESAPPQPPPKTTRKRRFKHVPPLPPLVSLALIGGILVMLYLLGQSASTVAAGGSSLMDWLGERVLHYVGKINSLGVVAKVVIVLFSTVPFIFLFGSLYTAFTNTPIQHSFIRMYALLNRLPGAEVLNEKTVPAAVLINAVYFLGLFTFAILLGVVTDEIKSAFKAVRDGKFPINQAKHVVVLNWSSQTIPLLRQVALAKAEGFDPLYSRPVAILADVPKSVMDEEVLRRLKGTGMEVVTRRGNPTVSKDLALVAAQRAATIIVLSPPHSKSSDPLAAAIASAQPIHTAVALTNLPSPPAPRNVVFQTPHNVVSAEDAVMAFTRITKDSSNFQLLGFSDKDFEARFTTLTAMQPGMVRVAKKLMGPEGCSIKTQNVPLELHGSTYKTARRMFADGIVIGYRKDGATTLLPSDSELLTEKDQLVILSDGGFETNYAAVPLFEAAAQRAADRGLRPLKYKPTPRHVIVITLNHEAVKELQTDFAEFAPPGSSVTFLLPAGEAEKLPSQSTQRGPCTVKFISPLSASTSPCTTASLKQAGIDTATSVVVAGLDHLPPTDADAFVTSTCLLVQDAVLSSSRLDAPHFVAQIQKHSTQGALNTYLNHLRQEALQPFSHLPGMYPSSQQSSKGWFSSAAKDAKAASIKPQHGSKSSATQASNTIQSNSDAASASSIHPPVLRVGPSVASSAAAAQAQARKIMSRPDFLLSNELLTCILAQAASQPYYSSLVAELLTQEGAELYFRNPKLYNIVQGDLLQFADVAEAVRLFNETALGYITANGVIVLGPEPSHPLNLQSGDKIITLAEQYEAIKLKKS